MDLEEAKSYLRIEGTTEDDADIARFIKASDQFLKGKGCVPDGNLELYDLAQKMIISHWYDNRQPTMAGTISGVSRAVEFSLQDMILQLKFYPPADESVLP